MIYPDAHAGSFHSNAVHGHADTQIARQLDHRALALWIGTKAVGKGQARWIADQPHDRAFSSSWVARAVPFSVLPSGLNGSLSIIIPPTFLPGDFDDS